MQIVECRLVILVGVGYVSIKIDSWIGVFTFSVDKLVEHLRRTVVLFQLEIAVTLLEIKFGKLLLVQILLPHTVEIVERLFIMIGPILIAAHFKIGCARARTFGIVVDELAYTIFGVAVK